MRKLILYTIIAIIAVCSIAFFIPAPKSVHITWGVNFSQMQAEALKLDWHKTYLAILQDLGAKNIRLLTQWDFVEGKKDVFYFNDIDWQIQQAERYGTKIIYVVGMKTGRWPECHLPSWANGLTKQEQQDELLQYVKEMVLRYKKSNAIIAWQAENEPLFKFGNCPWYDKNFLKKEVGLIKSLDSGRPVMVSDSGEQSLWIDAATVGDIIGTTMYQKAWFHISDNIGFYFNSPLPPISYWLKSQLIKKLFNKKVINVELQAEPWTSRLFYDVPLQDQEKTMNLDQFKKNINYARQTGFDEFYLWGTEWWYWLKEVKNQPQIWEEAKKLFSIGD